MYIMAVLCIIKLYQNRHPGVNANAYFTFLLLAIAVLIGMLPSFNQYLDDVNNLFVLQQW